MIYIEIPYSSENDRIKKDSAKKEIETLSIKDEEKNTLLQAIYHRNPRIVSFDNTDLKVTLSLQQTLIRLGVPFRMVEGFDH